MPSSIHQDRDLDLKSDRDLVNTNTREIYFFCFFNKLTTAVAPK